MKLSRREFVRLSGFAAGGLSLSTDLSWALPQATEPRYTSVKRVVILGAGLAGLSAGWELRNAGHDITILEAQLHPGGRVHTIREGLSDDLYAEAGAGRIPAPHSITLEWVKHFGLELEPFRPTQLSEVALLKGERVKIPPDKPVDMSQVPLDLTPEEKRVGLDDIEELYCGELMRKIGSAIREDWPPEMMRLADTSMEDFLHQREASADAIHYTLAGFEQQSALDYLRDDNNHYKQPKSKIKGGTDLLPRAFAAKLNDVIRYGSVVEHIERGENRVRIACRHAGMLDHVHAEAVICTIPFGVLRHISVTPEWTPEKRKVIDGVNYMAVVRTTFQVSRRYWEVEGLNGWGPSDKDFEVWHPTYDKPGPRGLLQAYFYGDYARRLDEMSEVDRTERMIGDMDEVHPGLRQHLETVVTKSWQADTWQRGAYTVHHPGQLEWYPEICRVRAESGSRASTRLRGQPGCRAQSRRELRRPGKLMRNLALQPKPTLKLM